MEIIVILRSGKEKIFKNVKNFEEEGSIYTIKGKEGNKGYTAKLTKNAIDIIMVKK